jgi:hypothetical protein
MKEVGGSTGEAKAAAAAAVAAAGTAAAGLLNPKP